MTMKKRRDKIIDMNKNKQASVKCIKNMKNNFEFRREKFSQPGA